MDNRLLLVKAITLRFRESELADLTSSSFDIINQALALVKVPEQPIFSEFAKDPVTSYRETLVSMMKQDPTYKFDKVELLQTLRVNSANDIYTYESFVDAIKPECTQDELKTITKSLRDNIRNFIAEQNLKDIIKGIYQKTHFSAEAVNIRDFVRELTADLEPFVNMHSGDEKHPALVDEVDFSDNESLRAIFDHALDELDLSGILKFGLQGFNELFGDHYGGRRGEMVMLGALQHQYKSGTTLDMFRSAALYNTPFMRDPSKKPLILRITFENSAKLDMLSVYKSLVENETGVAVDLRTIDTSEAIKYVQDRLGVNGYHMKLIHIDPSDFTFYDLFDVIIGLEAEGYEIHMLNLDYLNMVSKKGCVHGPHGVEIRDLFRRTRNFISARGIFTVTPHQLSTQAKEKIREGLGDEFVKLMVGKGFTDSCKTIDQEVDMEIFQHIVPKNGKFYMTWQRGKHRKVGITPEVYQYAVYEMNPVAGIPDDINTESRVMRKLPGSAKMDEGSWDFG